jgi:hypothetical protein
LVPLDIPFSLTGFSTAGEISHDTSLRSLHRRTGSCLQHKA